MAERGSGQTIACPGCGEQHQAVYRIEGLPVLMCPSSDERGIMRMFPVSRAVHATSFVIVIPPPREAADSEKAEITAGHVARQRRTT